MISVVIVNYHSAVQTERAVRSVLQDTSEKELIVVDNTCLADERDILEGMRKSYEFSLILNDENVGFAKACNQAFSMSKGKFVFLLNPDAFVASRCLGELRDFLERNPQVGSASPQVYWDDEMRYFFPHYTVASPLHSLCWRLSSLSRAFRTFYSLSERRKNLALWESSVPVKTKNLHGGVVMIRRSAAERAGGLFDDRFFMFYEDTDLFLRLRRVGYNLYILPEAKAVHNYSHSERKLQMMSGSGSLYYQKHYSESLLLRITASLPEGLFVEPICDRGTYTSPPSFNVPDSFREGYLFEWSPNPLFIPSIGCFGKGNSLDLSSQVWSFLDNGKYFYRFTPPRKGVLRFTTCCWKKGA